MIGLVLTCPASVCLVYTACMCDHHSRTQMHTILIGNRIVLFAPVYLANYCVNTCQYCAFRGANKQMQRSMLTMEELR